MKRILIVFALLIGLAGTSNASRSGQGWSAYTVSVSSAQIVTGPGFLGSMVLSTACTAGDYAIAFDTVAISTTSGVGYTSYADLISGTATVMTPQLVFGTTTTVNSAILPPGITYWSVGQAEDDFIEFSKGLFIFKNAWGYGGCDKVTVYYSK